MNVIYKHVVVGSLTCSAVVDAVVLPCVVLAMMVNCTWYHALAAAAVTCILKFFAYNNNRHYHV